MKKFGFTLIEIIIALCIVGVVAAITAPMLNNLIPDKDKIAALKLRKVIATVNEDILSNTALTAISDRSGLASLNGITKYDTGRTINGILIDANAKSFPYPVIFSRSVNTIGDETLSGFGNGHVLFNTMDGYHWCISRLAAPNANEFIITVDLMNEKKGRCTYNSTNCKKPGRFSYHINNRGLIYGNDPLTSSYLANAGKLNDKKNDYKKAAKDTKTYIDVALPTNFK